MEPLRAHDPDRLGGFRLLCRIGAGGFGEVFLGRESGRHGRLAAIKLIRRDVAESVRLRPRFRSEVEAVGRAAGEGVPELLGADAEADRPWLAVRYIPGPSLQELVEAAGPLPEDTVWGLAEGLAATLRGLHAHRLYHRDLKPSNVLVTRMRPWLIDFSLVRRVGDPRLTTVADAMGSFQYAAPEQADGLGRAQSEADVYALGAVLLFALTGHPPRDGENPMDIRLRALTEPPDLSGLPGGALARLVRECLEHAPSARPGIAAVVRSLARTGGPSPAPVPFPPGALRAFDRHRASLRSVAGVEDDFGEHDAPVPPFPPRAPVPGPDSGPVGERWAWRCHDWLREPPALHGDLVLVLTAGGSLHALDRADGREVWSLVLDAPPRGGLATLGDTAVVGTADGVAHVVGLGPDAGRSLVRQRFPAPVHAVLPASLAPGRGPSRAPLVLVCSRGETFLYDPAEQRALWRSRTGVVTGRPAHRGGTVYLRTDDGLLSAWRVSDGQRLWRTPVGGAGHSGPLLAPHGGGDRYDGFAGRSGPGDTRPYEDDPARALLRHGGGRGAGPVGRPLPAAGRAAEEGLEVRDGRDRGGRGDTVYTVSADGVLCALSARTGALLWARNLGGTVHLPPVPVDDVLVVATTEGVVTAVRAADGRDLWRSAGHIGLAGAAAGSGRVCVADRSGVTLLDARGGEPVGRWPAEGVCSVRVLSDGFLTCGLDGVLRSVRWPGAGDPEGSEQIRREDHEKSRSNDPRYGQEPLPSVTSRPSVVPPPAVGT
ncbi:PQQ-binding-like beta-propeller repeat protein [Streptomyces longwoodensis]|uniref:serine/threonine-protein kinase n=1 Tax=Streptomyces longwoodensis TaxID=68231 RepID=UPI003700C365